MILSAAGYSIERFLGYEDAACLIDVDTGVERVARHLFNKLSILLFGTLKHASVDDALLWAFVVASCAQSLRFSASQPRC